MTTIVNGRLLWQWNNAEIMSWNADFSFNWYNLANWTTVRVLSHNADDWWAVDFETFKYAQQDGGGVLSRYQNTTHQHCIKYSWRNTRKTFCIDGWNKIPVLQYRMSIKNKIVLSC